MRERQHAHRENAPASRQPGTPEYDPGSPPPELLTQNAQGLPYRFEDRAEVVHALEGSRLAPTDTRTFFMWTRCGQQDVPASEIYAGAARPTCPVCASIEQQSPGPDQYSKIVRLMRADLAFARGRARIARLEDEDQDASRAYDDTRNYEMVVRTLERSLGRGGPE